MCYVLRSISGGELFERVVADDFTLTERDSILFMRQICEGVEYMHQNKVVHLDLKVRKWNGRSCDEFYIYAKINTVFVTNLQKFFAFVIFLTNIIKIKIKILSIGRFANIIGSLFTQILKNRETINYQLHSILQFKLISRFEKFLFEL